VIYPSAIVRPRYPHIRHDPLPPVVMLPPQQGRDDSLRARQAQGRDAVKTRTRCRKNGRRFFGTRAQLRRADMLKTPDEWLIYGTMMFVMSIVSLVAEHQCPSDAWEGLCWAAPGSACLSMQQRASRIV
jgi:hypothetical protein